MLFLFQTYTSSRVWPILSKCSDDIHVICKRKRLFDNFAQLFRPAGATCMRLELLAYDMSETRRVTKRLDWIKYPDITHRKRRGVLCVSSCICVFVSPQCSGYRAGDTQQHADKFSSVGVLSRCRRQRRFDGDKNRRRPIIIRDHHHQPHCVRFEFRSNESGGTGPIVIIAVRAVHLA